MQIKLTLIMAGSAGYDWFIATTVQTRDPFLATLVALHLTPVSELVGKS